MKKALAHTHTYTYANIQNTQKKNVREKKNERKHMKKGARARVHTKPLALADGIHEGNKQ